MRRRRRREEFEEGEDWPDLQPADLDGDVECLAAGETMLEHPAKEHI